MHLLVSELHKDRVIDQAVFAIYLADDRRKSFAHFGGYDKKIVEESIKELQSRGIDTSDAEEGIYWVDINSDLHWQVRLSDAAIGDVRIRRSASDLIFDTGSSLCYMPSSDFRQFISEIRKNTNCAEHSDGLMYCDCDAQDDARFPTLAFKVGGRVAHWFYLKGRDYLLFS